MFVLSLGPILARRRHTTRSSNFSLNSRLLHSDQDTQYLAVPSPSFAVLGNLIGMLPVRRSMFVSLCDATASSVLLFHRSQPVPTPYHSVVVSAARSRIHHSHQPMWRARFPFLGAWIFVSDRWNHHAACGRGLIGPVRPPTPCSHGGLSFNSQVTGFPGVP
jgi:hypothetical protein